MTDSRTLLAEYAQHGAEEAFSRLVSRYIDMVYSTAHRLMDGDRHRAEEVAQTVFIDLAMQARTLSPEVMLGGWLHRHTCYVAAHAWRADRRRRFHERQAVEMNALEGHREQDPEVIAPILDEAVNRLGEVDRRAILLRFFEQLDFRAVGAALGSNEDAARMRVNRALEKLRLQLQRRGMSTTAAALSQALAALAAHAAQTAPAGLAATISTAAAIKSAAVSITFTTTKALAMTAIQKFLVAGTLTVAVATALYQGHQTSNLRAELASLRESNSERIRQLERENEAANRKLLGVNEENARARNDATELARLRAELARLRIQEQERVRQSSAGQPASDIPAPPKGLVGELPTAAWTDAGFGTPEATLKTRGWSVLNGNRERFSESVAITDGARKLIEDMIVKMAEASTDPDKERLVKEAVANKWGAEEAMLMPMMAQNQDKGFTGYRIVSQQTPSADEMILEVETEMASAPAQRETLRLARFGNDWKVVIDEEAVRGGGK